MASIIGAIWQTVSASGSSNTQESEQDSEQLTPKAQPAPDIVVPTFSLDHDAGDDLESKGKRAGVPQGPAPNRMADISPTALSPPAANHPAAKVSPNISSATLSPRTSAVRNAGLMPPPSRGPGLPLPNRGPPLNSQQRAGSNSRGKVLLSPGHSPMDWASLTRTANLSGVPSLQRVTPSQMKKMNGRKGNPIWSSYQGKVYNITPYLPFHPGGEKELIKSAGRDGTKLFTDVHPWVNWEGMLSACLVGILVSEDAVSELDSLD